MRIVALEPFLTALTVCFGRAEELVGASCRCSLAEELGSVARVTKPAQPGAASSALARSYRLETGACSDVLNLEALRQAGADIVLTRIPAEREITPLILSNVREDVSALLGHEVAVHSYAPATLDEVLAMYEQLGRDLECADRGIDLAHRQKAQFMVWGDSFYDRMKNKRVSFISGVDPLRLAGWWIPDMIRGCSAASQSAAGKPPRECEWREVLEFKPDVILVAPEGMALEDSMRLFSRFERLPDWEQLPAVKRGEVYFAGGAEHFYRPGPALIESMGILMSAVAGFESGYITPRECFYKLRWLELQRHRLK